MIKQLFILFLNFVFLWNCVAPLHAGTEGVSFLPAPGVMVNLSPAHEPALIKGLRVHPNNPFLFDFIVDSGNSALSIDGLAFKEESQKLIKYFLSALTIPEKDLWVNLSPYEKDRMIASNLGQTQMGQDMLAQDYLLKQLTASMIYPEKGLGKEFWDKVYAKMSPEANGQPISMDAFNKVWIVADRADIVEGKDAAYVTNAHLKVMLEEDYLATKKNVDVKKFKRNDITNTLKQIVLPAIEKEVNEGKNFTQLRQMYHSMILASWYKMRLKNALMAQIYGNQSKVTSTVNANDPQDQEAIFKRYLQAYKKGVFNIIQEEIDPKTYQKVPRKYFSGGLNIDAARAIRTIDISAIRSIKSTGNLAMVTSPFRVSFEENLKGQDQKSVPTIPIKRTVLIVESDRKLLDTIKKEIIAWGYEPISVRSLNERVKTSLIKRNVYVDLLITGQNGDDGRASIDFSRTQWPHSPVVLIHDIKEVEGEEDLSALYGTNDDERVDKKIDRTRFENNLPTIKKDIRSLLKPKVLLVTENKVYATIQVDLLTKQGYDVTVVDYQRVSQSLVKDKFDVIVTDFPLSISTLPQEPKLEGIGHKLLLDLALQFPSIPILYRWPITDNLLSEINHPKLIVVPVQLSFSDAVLTHMPIDAAQLAQLALPFQKVLVVSRDANQRELIKRARIKNNELDEVLGENGFSEAVNLKEAIAMLKNFPDQYDQKTLIVLFGISKREIDFNEIIKVHSLIVQDLNSNLYAHFWNPGTKQWFEKSLDFDDREIVSSTFPVKYVPLKDAMVNALELTLNESAKSTDKAVGGIDFNKAKLNISKQGDGLVMNFDQHMIDQIKTQGFAGIDFHIERIIPISNLQHILGV